MANMMQKPLEFKNITQLRELIEYKIKSKIKNTFCKTNNISFIEKDISIKPIDYYYSNSIARSSKTMSECRQIKKKFPLSGIDKAS